MKRIKLAVLAIFTMGLAVGCGSSDSSSAYRTSDNIRERFSFLDRGFVSTRNSTKACIQAGVGESYTLDTSFEHKVDPFIDGPTKQTVMSVLIEEYRKTGCAGEPLRSITQEYILFIGEEVNQGTRLQIDVLITKFDFSFQDIRDFSEAIIFGTNVKIGERFHTVIVGQGGIQTDTLKYGFANPDPTHNGDTTEFRAQDVSKYTSGNTFLLQI